MNHTASGLTTCPLCAAEFDRAQAHCGHGCPLDSVCNLIRCPRCSYESPDDRRYKNLWDRLFKRRSAKPPSRELPPDVMPLPEAPVGMELQLDRLTCVLQSRRNSLSVYGLVPGSRLILQQTEPTCVVRVGATELALDHDIARELVVKPWTSAAPPSALPAAG